MIKQEGNQRNFILYGATVVANINYAIIFAILVLFAEVPFNNLGGYSFIVGFVFSLVAMIMIARNALMSNANRTKTLAILALAHVPCVFGAVMFIIFGFELV